MITERLLDQVTAVVAREGLSEATVSRLRQSFNGSHFTYCMDDDIYTGKAYRQCQGYNIYLVSSQDHCSVLTNDAERASGVVLAELDDD